MEYDGLVHRRAAVPISLLCLTGVLLLACIPGVRSGVGHAVGLLVGGDLIGLRDYLRSFGVWAPLLSVTLMQVQAVLAPLPSFPLMYANGLLFGALWGGLLSWGSILLSAVVCFGLARAFGRPLVGWLVSPAALAWADRRLVRYGLFAIFLGRLIPLVSFDLVSYAAGLTGMRLSRFCLATALGMTPAIFLTAAAGEIGLRSPWALAGGVAAIAALGACAAWLRPALVRWLRPPAIEASRGV